MKRSMLVTFFILIHGLLARVICRPWDIEIKYKMTPKRRLNVRVIGSILYHLIMDNFEELKPIPGNESHLTNKQKTERAKNLYLFGKRKNPKLIP